MLRFFFFAQRTQSRTGQSDSCSRRALATSGATRSCESTIVVVVVVFVVDANGKSTIVGVIIDTDAAARSRDAAARCEAKFACAAATDDTRADATLERVSEI